MRDLWSLRGLDYDALPRGYDDLLLAFTLARRGRGRPTGRPTLFHRGCV